MIVLMTRHILKNKILKFLQAVERAELTWDMPQNQYETTEDSAKEIPGKFR